MRNLGTPSTDETLTSITLQPRNISRDGVFVPIEFRNAVLLHITRNYLRNTRPPLILAIQGPPGEGKSFQVREICSEMGVPLVCLSGSTLSGPYEGEAISPLKNAYVYASSLRQQKNRMVAILIDDFDLSVASKFERTENTVNSQLLSGFLMNLADDPLHCGDQATHRVPIIVTGNNFRALHGPLTRHGRMNFFDWKPNKEHKEAIVRQILMPLFPNRGQETIRQLVDQYKSQPISFFANLKEDLLEKIILDTISTDGRVNLESIEAAISQKQSSITIKDILLTAEIRNRMAPSRFPE